MSKTLLKEMFHQLNEEQKQSLYNNSLIYDDSKYSSDIALIGIGGRYPLADNHYEFWDKLSKNKNFIQNIPKNRWDHSKYYDPNTGDSYTPGKTRCKFGAFLNDYDTFDASFFDINDNEVEFIQPHDRIALETSWSCIEDAGYNPEEFDEETGVFAGLTNSDFQKLVPFTSHLFFLVNRISFFYNFQGPAMVTDTGCSSSLTAINSACQNLLTFQCKTALVIGANIILHPDHYTGASHMLSPSTKPLSNPFGTDDGWFPAEGVVSILLKPLKSAIEDKDYIYAVIKSSHIGHEGKTARFTASNPKKHSKLIYENFKKSGINPETISYVESSANGSSFGDAIEIEGLRSAFSHFTNKRKYCPIGSVKANVGHGEGVSTLLALTKLLLQFKNKSIYPILNLDKINSKIKEDNIPFYFPVNKSEWIPPKIYINEKQFECPRRATLSSFGAGGMFGHLIIEEYKNKIVKQDIMKEYFIPLSAKTNFQLINLLKMFDYFVDLNHVIDTEWENNYTLLNMMFTLCEGRKAFKHRVVFIVKNVSELVILIKKYLNGEDDANIIVSKKKTESEKVLLNQEKNTDELLSNHNWHDLANLWVNGSTINWKFFFNEYKVNRIPLPTYNFVHQSFPL